MAFERKSGRQNPVTLTNDLPERFLTELPQAVVDRFPEMKWWQEQNHQRWVELREVHQRHLQELTDGLNDALAATKPTERTT